MWPAVPAVPTVAVHATVRRRAPPALADHPDHLDNLEYPEKTAREELTEVPERVRWSSWRSR